MGLGRQLPTQTIQRGLLLSPTQRKGFKGSPLTGSKGSALGGVWGKAQPCVWATAPPTPRGHRQAFHLVLLDEAGDQAGGFRLLHERAQKLCAFGVLARCADRLLHGGELAIQDAGAGRPSMSLSNPGRSPASASNLSAASLASAAAWFSTRSSWACLMLRSSQRS